MGGHTLGFRPQPQQLEPLQRATLKYKFVLFEPLLDYSNLLHLYSGGAVV